MGAVRLADGLRAPTAGILGWGYWGLVEASG